MQNAIHQKKVYKTSSAIILHFTSEKSLSTIDVPGNNAVAKKPPLKVFTS
jgi:hypothetical protein